VLQGLRSPLQSASPSVELVSAVPVVLPLASGSHVVSPAPALAGTHVSATRTALLDEVFAGRVRQTGSGQPSQAARSLTAPHQGQELSLLDGAFAELASGRLFRAGRLDR
jgi:hypothetical protein